MKQFHQLGNTKLRHTIGCTADWGATVRETGGAAAIRASGGVKGTIAVETIAAAFTGGPADPEAFAEFTLAMAAMIAALGFAGKAFGREAFDVEDFMARACCTNKVTQKVNVDTFPIF